MSNFWGPPQIGKNEFYEIAGIFGTVDRFLGGGDTINGKYWIVVFYIIITEEGNL